jgi:putative ABC transport system permease protein
MYKIYFTQAIEMLKQNKFISIVTIAGTALAIMMIMVIVVSESIKNTSIPPEANRDRTLYLTQERDKRKDDKATNNSGAVTYKIYKSYLSDLKTPEATTVVSPIWTDKSIVAALGHEMERVSLNVKMTDANFWKVMTFNFIEGKPFSQEDVNSGIKNAVITATTARLLYGSTDVAGKTININFKPYTITGVADDVSAIFKFAYADVYIPYTSRSGYEENWFYIMLLAKNKEDFGKIRDEIRGAERKFNAADPEWNLELPGPYDHQVQQLAVWANLDPDVKGYTRKTIFILAVLLLIPAVNLSGFSLSRIKRRTEEIGVRKAFGAKKYVILIQVLYENFVTSLIGGFIGLLLSYLVVVRLKQWMLDIEAGSNIPLETFISPSIFFAVFLASLLLNLLSAGIPAYRASKVKIIDSLNNNNKAKS